MAGKLVASIVGGAGNQLYCWATALAAARKSNLDLELELSSYERDPYGRVYLLSKLGITDASTKSYTAAERAAIGIMARIANKKDGYFRLANRTIYTDVAGKLNFKLLEEIPTERCYLRGYWQSPRYFADQRNELRAAVKFEPCHAADTQAETICVHIRSFNEASAAVIGRISEDYYKAAYERCHARFVRPKFVVYSDDLPWAGKNGFLPATYQVGGQAHRDSCLDHDLCELLTMSRYQNLIIANSSFSWWAAYLSVRSPWVQAPGTHRRAWFSEEPLPAEWDEV